MLARELREVRARGELGVQLVCALALLDHDLADLHAFGLGELLAVLCAGAYGFAMASNYNSRPRPPEVIVDRGRYAVVRPREELDATLAAEKIEPFA